MRTILLRFQFCKRHASLLDELFRSKTTPKLNEGTFKLEYALRAAVNPVQKSLDKSVIQKGQKVRKIPVEPRTSFIIGRRKEDLHL